MYEMLIHAVWLYSSVKVKHSSVPRPTGVNREMPRDINRSQESVTGLVRLDDVQQLRLGLVGQTHAQPLRGHSQLVDGRDVVPQHHPVLVQHLRRGRGRP